GLQGQPGSDAAVPLCHGGRSPVLDYVIEEKTAMLQKRESEGFGFVLRGAKAETPIEEFAPTPAFPALQYLESVDQGGVAWRAGLRTGDFLIEVNGTDVVKVGHRQVVSLIRQGGSRLLMKVVSVSRKSETNLIRKKAPPPPKRAPSTSLTLRSKSMTADLEEIGKTNTHFHPERSPTAALCFCFWFLFRLQPGGGATVSQTLSLFERQGLVPPSAPEKSTMALPRGMSRTKSFGKTGGSGSAGCSQLRESVGKWLILSSPWLPRQAPRRTTGSRL
uniref:SH3 and multiple ankyrin repeat domains protein 3-like n=1 Tax=Kryptolebias marmoratus TaxID=37003 RepID=A0A3Q3F8R9_KRYMA